MVRDGARDPAGQRPARVVTLYGSGDPPQDVFAFAEELGEGIARRGWILRNGGYGGTMEAAARGASRAGGRVVGITCGALGRHSHNRYLSEAFDTANLFERLSCLTEDADAFGAFQGGTGTLTEVFLTWELMVKGLLPRRPLCLLGAGWDPWWELMEREPLLRPRLPLLSRAGTVHEALRCLGGAPPGETSAAAGVAHTGAASGGEPRNKVESGSGSTFEGDPFHFPSHAR